MVCLLEGSLLRALQKVESYAPACVKKDRRHLLVISLVETQEVYDLDVVDKPVNFFPSRIKSCEVIREQEKFPWILENTLSYLKGTQGCTTAE